jgi:hypothetical protein
MVLNGFLTYWPSCLLEAYGGPEKYWLLCFGLLAAHIYDLNFIFLSQGLLAVAE